LVGPPLIGKDGLVAVTASPAGTAAPRPGGSGAAAAGLPAGYLAAAHRLRDQYAALPPTTPVRLAKRTSNLFRFGADPAGRAAARLDPTGLDRVFSVDPAARTADVGAMTRYEDLVEVTLRHGLLPLVVPELRTITVGGAVTGLGIEATSFRHGMPHESVLEADVLTGAGELLTVRPEPAGPHPDLFRGLPNSYGTLGYLLRLVVELQPVEPFVHVTHRRYTDPAAWAGAVAELADEARGGAPTAADFLDGVAFRPDELYLSVGRFTGDPGRRRPSDYTTAIYYRSVRERAEDLLSVRDYLWRWDTDWFWCSRAFGAQHPLVRPLWPRRWRRSDVYWRLVAADERLGLTSRLDRARHRPPAEKVIQDVEIPLDRLAEFLPALDRLTGLRPAWLCPVRLRAGQPWPLYPLRPGELYVNVGFWGSVRTADGEPPASRNRAVERLVTDLGGAKSLYSTAYYDRAEFDRLYGGAEYRTLKDRYDPQGRLADLYTKTVGSGKGR
jgi:FAD/FMN-containing dehydrogenase